MVHFYSPSSTFFFPKFNLLNLEEFLTLFAKYYLINKQILTLLDVSVDVITKSVYNSTERIVKFCDQAFQLCKKQQLYFINFEDLFIDATNMNGYLPVDLTFFRRNPEEHDKLMKKILNDPEIKFKVDRKVLDLFGEVVNIACTSQEHLRDAARNASQANEMFCQVARDSWKNSDSLFQNRPDFSEFNFDLDFKSTTLPLPASSVAKGMKSLY
jgi:hypothetical protein